eukprot:SAG31_NODE_21210_length_555_cov_0.817982_1_plen_79_part_10
MLWLHHWGLVSSLLHHWGLVSSLRRLAFAFWLRRMELIKNLGFLSFREANLRKELTDRWCLPALISAMISPFVFPLRRA